MLKNVVLGGMKNVLWRRDLRWQGQGEEDCFLVQKATRWRGWYLGMYMFNNDYYPTELGGKYVSMCMLRTPQILS